MSDKEADKFNNINLSSDSDQGNKSSEGEISETASRAIQFQHSSSTKLTSRRSSRHRKTVIDSKVRSNVISIKNKPKIRKRRRFYQRTTFKFKSDKEGLNDSKFKGPCYCKSQTTKCIKLTEQDRRAIFEHVRSLPVEWRYGYVTELVRRFPIKGKFSLKEPSRKRAWVIYFHLTKLCGTILPVCKMMFINTTGLTSNFIRKSLIKKEVENSQSIISEPLPCDNCDKELLDTKRVYPDQHETGTPSLFCQFDDHNNPIVVTTWESHSTNFHKAKSKSKCLDKLPTSDIHHCNDQSKSSPPSEGVDVTNISNHQIKSLESSHLEAASINSDKCDNKTLQSQSNNQREVNEILSEEDTWMPRHNKTPRDLGQSYVTKRGKFVPARKLKDRCWCRSITTRCFEITEDDRRAVFEHVWSLAKDEKKDFISEFVERTPVKRKRTPTSKKEWTFQFNMRKVTGDVIPVCKKMFMKTTSLTSFLIRTTVAKKDLNAASMIEPESLFYSKYSYDDQHAPLDESPESPKDIPSLVCQFDEENNPIVVTAYQSHPEYLCKDRFKSKLTEYSTGGAMSALENEENGEFSMPDNCSDSVSDSCMNTSSTLSLDPDTNPNDEEEKQKLIEQVLERQNTLDDLSSRVDSVKVENLKLKSENQVLGQYIENLMAASSVFQSASPKAKKK